MSQWRSRKETLLDTGKWQRKSTQMAFEQGNMPEALEDDSGSTKHFGFVSDYPKMIPLTTVPVNHQPASEVLSNMSTLEPQAFTLRVGFVEKRYRGKAGKPQNSVTWIHWFNPQVRCWRYLTLLSSRKHHKVPYPIRWGFVDKPHVGWICRNIMKPMSELSNYPTLTKYPSQTVEFKHQSNDVPEFSMVLCRNKTCGWVTWEWIVWWFPKIGVPSNHLDFHRISHEINHPASLGYPHYGNPHLHLKTVNSQLHFRLFAGNVKGARTPHGSPSALSRASMECSNLTAMDHQFEMCFYSITYHDIYIYIYMYIYILYYIIYYILYIIYQISYIYIWVAD